MADADVSITAGTGTKIDTRTVGAGTDEHRQVVVVGDPTTAAGVATVDAANGLDVDVTRLPALPAGTNNIGDVGIASVPTLTKGTQGATGFSTQDLKDSGRVNIAWTLDTFVTTAVAETLMTMTESRDGAATSTFTTKVITSGKRLRLTSLTVGIGSGGSAPATIMRIYVRIRVNNAGAVTTASPIQFVTGNAVQQTTRNMTEWQVSFPDGVEYLGDGTKQIGVTVASPDWVTGTTTPFVHLALTAFEY